VGVQVLVVQLPLLQSVFDTVALSAEQWGACFLAALVFLAIDEARSVVERARRRAREPRPGSSVTSAG
jgi:hypothetical protein